MIDFIGDIHGHADKLKALLAKLGYVFKNNSYTHPERKVLFAGDYIDRGPQIRETLEIVKAMVDSGNAIALMGNHEYNALCFYVTETKGGYLRNHSIKNIIQHYQTLLQFHNRQSEYEAYLEWFKTLPLFYETSNFRAVHACWDDGNIAYLQTALHNNCFTDELIYQSVKKGSALNHAIDNTLKGKEILLPEGQYFTDSDGNKRTEIRIKWWEDPTKISYKNISVEAHEDLSAELINIDLLSNASFYAVDSKPVFFGHYWLKGNPVLYRNNICCLDYSVAKNGNLVAYRFDGEEKLSNSKLVFV